MIHELLVSDTFVLELIILEFHIAIQERSKNQEILLLRICTRLIVYLLQISEVADRETDITSILIELV